MVLNQGAGQVDVLSSDVKTVDRHINNIYSKLHSDLEEGPEESRHPRVQAALTYLRATGLLSATTSADSREDGSTVTTVWYQRHQKAPG